MNLLEVTGLTKSFVTKRDLWGRVRARHEAVRGVDLHVAAGETLALVGESGAGKSTVGRMVVRLVEPDGGRLLFEGADVSHLARRELTAFRRRVQMVFQDPFSSLDPRIPVGESIGEPMWVHFRTSGAERAERVRTLLDQVGLAAATAERVPAELSGGQLQRVAIARALSLEPALIVCDEPVAALDVSVRAQVLNVMRDLQEQLGVAYLFVSHDLALVEVIADRIAVMRRGEIVETGPTADIYRAPRHEYTKALLEAVPVPIPPALRGPAAARIADR